MKILKADAFWSGVSVPLTPEQRAAIAHAEGPLLVVAGPGSGKTTVITYRAAYLTRVAGVDPASLLVVTFTKAAADSMKARTARIAGAAVAGRATFGTFHALAYRLLRQGAPGRRFRMLEENEQIGMVRQFMQQASLGVDDEAVLDAVAELGRMRAAAQPPEDFRPQGMNLADFLRLVKAYRDAKARLGALDFDDLLHEALALLHSQPELLAAYRSRYRYLMIDEFQDTSPIQWDLVQLLAEPERNICVVGDDDQAIYGWRGARPDFLLAFPRQYPDAVQLTLGVNHRCPPAVVDAANRLAAQNRHRFGKVVRPAKRGGGRVEVITPADSLQEAEEILRLLKRPGVDRLSDWAVIYRTNQQAHAIAQILARDGISYRVLGGMPNLYRRWPVQDVLAYLKAAAGDGSGLEQVLNRPNRYIGRAVLQEARKLAGGAGPGLLDAIGQTGMLRSWQMRPVEDLQDHLRRLSLLLAPDAIGYVRSVIGYDEYLGEYCAREGGSADEMRELLAEVQRLAPPVPLMAYLAQIETFSDRTERRADPGEEAVTLVTCHKAKGLEFRHVVIAGATDKLMPHRGADDLEEERRLMYVAMTRASERLYLSAPGAWSGREARPSPFIEEALGRTEMGGRSR